MNLGNEWSAKDESNNTGDRVGEFKVDSRVRCLEVSRPSPSQSGPECVNLNSDGKM